MKHGVLIDREAMDNLIAYMSKIKAKGCNMWADSLKFHLSVAPAEVMTIDENGKLKLITKGDAT